MTRRFRNRLLYITVHNPQRVCQGVVKMTVDGQETPGNLVPLDALTNPEHRVEIWLGA